MLNLYPVFDCFRALSLLKMSLYCPSWCVLILALNMFRLFKFLSANYISF